MYGKITLNSLNPRQASSEFQSLSTLNRITCFSSSKFKNGSRCLHVHVYLLNSRLVNGLDRIEVFMTNHDQDKT